MRSGEINNAYAINATKNEYLSSLIFLVYFFSIRDCLNFKPLDWIWILSTGQALVHGGGNRSVKKRIKAVELDAASCTRIFHTALIGWPSATIFAVFCLFQKCFVDRLWSQTGMFVTMDG